MSNVKSGVRRRHLGIESGRATHSPGRNAPDASAFAGEVYDRQGVEQITKQDISPGSVDIGAFASGLAPVNIVAALPTLPSLAYPIGSFVVLTSNGKLYRNVADAWDASVAGDDIVASSIVAGTVTAGALSVAQIVVHNGALTLKDEFAQTVLIASGFRGAWEELQSLGLYNASFRAGVNGALVNGRSSQLPYWTVARVNTSGSGLFERTTNVVWPGGAYVRFKPGGTSDSLRLTSDYAGIVGGKEYIVSFVYAASIGGAANLRVTVTVEWYRADETTLISTSTFTRETGTALGAGGVTVPQGPIVVPDYDLTETLQAPYEARFAAVSLKVEEITAHNAGVDFRLAFVSFGEDQQSPAAIMAGYGRDVFLAHGGTLGDWAVGNVLGVGGTSEFQDVADFWFSPTLSGRTAWHPARIEGFIADNPPASAGATTFGRFVATQNIAYINRPIVGRPGRVVAFAWRKTAAITAGQIDLYVVVGGASTLVLSLTSADGNSGTAILGTPVTFTQNQSVGIDFQTDAGYLPVTLDYAIDILVEYEALA